MKKWNRDVLLNSNRLFYKVSFIFVSVSLCFGSQSVVTTNNKTKSLIKEKDYTNLDILKKAQKQCAVAAEKIDGSTITLKVDADFYEKHRKDFQVNIPDNEFCTFIVATKEKWWKYYKVVYGWAVWETDASNFVEEGKRKLTEKKKELTEKKKELTEKKKELLKLEKMVEAEWYLWYLQKKVIFMWNNVNNVNLLNKTLDEILWSLKMWNLRWNKYWEWIKQVLDLIKTMHPKSEISRKIDILLERLKLN